MLKKHEKIKTKKDDERTEVRDKDKMLKITKKFYTELYSSKLWNPNHLEDILDINEDWIIFAVESIKRDSVSKCLNNHDI